MTRYAQLNIAYPQGPLLPVRVASRQFRISRPCVVYTRNGLSAKQEKKYKAKIRNFVDACTLLGYKLPFTIDKHKWDETSQEVAVPTSVIPKYKSPLAIPDGKSPMAIAPVPSLHY